MTFWSGLELIGAAACACGLFFVAQSKRRLTSDARLTLFTLFALVGLVHLLDALEWSGVAEADRFGDIFKIFVPAVWLFFLFVIRRDGLLLQVDEKQQQLDFFFDQAPMAIAVLDGRDRYLATSQKWLEVNDLDGPLIGRPLVRQDRPLTARFQTIVEESRSVSYPPSGLEQIVLHERSTWLEWKVRPFRSEHGACGTMLLLEDVTERVRQEQARESAQTALLRQQNLEMIGEIAAGVAHDVNNLLQVISAHASALDASHGPEEFRDSLDSIRDAVLSASGMTRWLLEHGRKTHDSFGIIELRDVVHRLSHLLERALPRNQRLRVDYFGESFRIFVNETLIEQLVINLVLNARDSMMAGGEIAVRLWKVGQRVRLEVEDQGSGIDDEIRDRILEPFFTTKGDRGTGMGLAVVQRVILAHRADLQLRSRSGEGSLFSVTFPEPEPGMERQLPASKQVSSARNTLTETG